MKKFIILMTALMTLVLSSCTVNDRGEFELTWLFWALLIGFAIFFIFGMIHDKKEAEKRGISVEELIEEKKSDIKKRQMSTGFDVDYLGGYPKWPNPCKVNFSIDGSSIVLQKGSESFRIEKDEILAISNEKSGHRSVGKTAAGAIVGGVLTGGIGLIVGGALGARKQNTSEVFVTYKYNGVELTLNLKPDKNTDKVYAWINSVFA